MGVMITYKVPVKIYHQRTSAPNPFLSNSDSRENKKLTKVPFFPPPSASDPSPFSSNHLLKLSCANTIAPPTYVSSGCTNSSNDSSIKGFFEEFLTEKMATLSFKSRKDWWALMSAKALRRELGEVSVGKASRTREGVCECRDLIRSARESGRRAGWVEC